jgi:hypothetical protein
MLGIRLKDRVIGWIWPTRAATGIAPGAAVPL